MDKFYRFVCMVVKRGLLREKNKLQVYKNKMLSKIFEAMREELGCSWFVKVA
jgi:hypothetical protein